MTNLFENPRAVLMMLYMLVEQNGKTVKLTPTKEHFAKMQQPADADVGALRYIVEEDGITLTTESLQ